MKVFVLGAGIGRRLLPLTKHIPKPLIPVIQRPLITFPFDHILAEVPEVDEFIVNTHHCSESYQSHFPDSQYRGVPIRFCYEPVLLNTGGALKNISHLVGDETCLVYNGDILTDLPLKKAIKAHQESDFEVTLVLRTLDGPKCAAFNPDTNEVLDLNHSLKTNFPHPYSFACIYLFSPKFLKRIPENTSVSVIPFWLDLIQKSKNGSALGGLGGVLLDEGVWFDLGSRQAYFEAINFLLNDKKLCFPKYVGNSSADSSWKNRIHPTSHIPSTSKIDERSIIGADCIVGERVVLENSIIWPKARLAPDTRLKNCIVSVGKSISGNHQDSDF